MNPKIKPSMKLSSIYGTDLIFLGRPSPNARRWLPRNEISLDMLTSSMLTVVGDMPIVCAASVSSHDALCLLRDAGFQISCEIYRYFDVADYMSMLKKICADESVVAVQHVHPLTDIPAEFCCIEPETLSFVNNKANLNKLVPPGNTPVREIVSVDQMTFLDRKFNLPFIIKAVTNESTGGGIDVGICREIKDIEKATADFADCQHVVVEEYLDIRKNLCLNYCVKADGEINYLGFAEQVSDEQGMYQGNWIEAGDKCSLDAIEVGISICRKAFEMGYYGIVGIDLAVFENGNCKVFDLNFRCNGSTPALLYAESLYKHHPNQVMRFRRMTGRYNYRDLLNSVYKAMDKGILLPLGSCDPEAGPYVQEKPILNGIILGENRQHIMENERDLISMGLDI